MLQVRKVEYKDPELEEWEKFKKSIIEENKVSVVCVCLSVQVFVCVCVRIIMHACMLLHLYLCVSVHMCMCMNMCPYVCLCVTCMLHAHAFTNYSHALN